MELRLFLFERRIPQLRVCEAAQRLGLPLDQGDLSRFCNGKINEPRAALLRDRIRRALLALDGVTPADVHAIPDLREPKRTAREA